ncbi:hypothetical protein PR202_gb02266 [Eleusine coracana subsp. coracana]|uniref:Uncharacterized protein n=1 Tax=Eleusine coracana subsp. coracana TaxID=191504 RepID=A0AAV5DYI8_ELECO|nr:hypothetical protein PR202_gb02266 [Eleusine coracana subsp. coracana]
MVKLATAREARLYGPALAVRRWEYMNAGVYVFATLLLASSLAALFDVGGAARAGLAAAGVALAVAAAVNAHDLWAHLAGVDWRIGLARYDLQLGLVELLVPAMHAVGCVLAVVAMAILISQACIYGKERHAANLVVAAALLWMVGSVLNACQVYERADGRAQLLQATVQVPLLLGSLFFLLAAVANRGRTRSPLLVFMMHQRATRCASRSSAAARRSGSPGTERDACRSTGKRPQGGPSCADPSIPFSLL